MSCIFCKIAAHEIKSSGVYETENVVAFDDVSPKAPVHVIVIPKKHAEKEVELKGTLFEIFDVIEEVAIKKGLAEKGYRIVMNRGKEAGQTVDHLHFHVLGGRALSWPPG